MRSFEDFCRSYQSFEDYAASLWDDEEALESAAGTQEFADAFSYEHGEGWALDLIAENKADELMKRLRDLFFQHFDELATKADAEWWENATKQERMYRELAESPI